MEWTNNLSFFELRLGEERFITESFVMFTDSSNRMEIRATAIWFKISNKKLILLPDRLLYVLEHNYFYYF